MHLGRALLVSVVTFAGAGLLSGDHSHINRGDDIWVGVRDVRICKGLLTIPFDTQRRVRADEDGMRAWVFRQDDGLVAVEGAGSDGKFRPLESVGSEGWRMVRKADGITQVRIILTGYGIESYPGVVENACPQ